jgi:hypothetical protein
MTNQAKPAPATPPPASAPKPPGGTPKGKAQPWQRRSFYHRLLLAMILAFGLIGFALALGILGYRYIAGFTWVDSLLNASMILSGMGPVGTLDSNAAKVFASAYALFSGLVFIGATGILLTPVFHRVLHRFHIEEKDIQ